MNKTKRTWIETCPDCDTTYMEEYKQFAEKPDKSRMNLFRGRCTHCEGVHLIYGYIPVGYIAVIKDVS